jgi:hypothetical protein
MVYWYTTCSDTPISSMPRYCRKNFIGKMPLFTSLLRPHDECKPRALAGCESIPLWLYGIQPCNTSTFKKKGLQWLLHVPTKRNLKVVAATMIHCAKFAELLTSHPVPLSPSSTVNWSRGECHVNMRSKVNYYKNSSLLWRFVANTLFAITTELHSAFLRQAQHAFYAVCIHVSNFLTWWVAVHPKRRHQGISLDWR